MTLSFNKKKALKIERSRKGYGILCRSDLIQYYTSDIKPNDSSFVMLVRAKREKKKMHLLLGNCSKEADIVTHVDDNMMLLARTGAGKQTCERTRIP